MAQEIADSKLIDTWSSGGNIVTPDISKIIEGWQLGEQPPHEYMNWLQNTFGSKLNHILKNGVATWNNKTEYLAGSSVQHNGNVWLCKTTNTDSAPTDANANWKRIITVESLTTVLAGYVDTNTNQDIDGIKNFLKSPTAPTPASSDNSTKVATTAWSKLGFAYSFTTNGYIKFPNWLGGLIIQWGQSAMTSDDTAIITFPIAFPNGALNYLATLGSKLDGTYSHSIGIGPTETPKTTAKVTITSTGAPLLTGFNWLVFGY